MSLEDLEAELYGLKAKRKADQAKIKQSAPPPEKEAPREWEEEEPEPGVPHSPWRRIILISSLFLFAVAVIVGALLISRLNSNGQGVDLLVSIPSMVHRGMPFDVSVSIANNLDSLITNSSLTIKLPSGLVNLGGLNSDQTLVQEDVGDVAVGSLEKRPFEFLAAGDPQSIQKIDITFSYVSGGRTRYEAKKTAEVTIDTPAIKVEVQKPDHVLRSSPFSFEIKYTNISDFDFKSITLTANYPTSFKFISSAELPPDSLNNHWNLGELKAGSSGTLQIKGSCEGTDDTLVVPYVLSASFLGNDYPVVQDSVSLALAPSPISVQILANGRTDYVARIGDDLTYTVQYQNMSGIALADVVIKMSLISDLFDMASVKTQANIDSVANTLTWNASNVPQLRLLDPGASGEVNVGLKLKSSFPTRRLSDKNYVLRASVTMDSPSVPYYLQASKTSASASLETKVAGLVSFDAKAFYRDAAAAIVNDGLLPPKVNQSTEYTIHWIIKSYSTDIKNVQIKASLQSGVVWTNMVKSNIDSVPLYNDRTGEVTWAIATIPATKGILSDPVEAVFQVEATPNSTQVNQYEPLLSESVLTALDDFTGLNIELSDSALSTALPDDPTVGQGGGLVVQ